RKAGSRLISISGPRLLERRLELVEEHLSGLRADGGGAGEDERRGRHGAELDARGRVLIDDAGDLLGAEVRGEPLDVQALLLSERDEGVLVELAGGAHLSAGEEGAVVLGVTSLQGR